MDNKARRKELQAQYRQERAEAGAFRITNVKNGRMLIGSSANLDSIRNKLKFAKSANVPSVLDQRLSADIRQFGLDSFSFEVLEMLDTRPEMTPRQILDDLVVLEQLWREKLDASLFY